MEPARQHGEVDLAFRPMTRDDMGLMARWRAAPHVERWYGDDHSPAELEAEYGATIDGKEPTELFIVELDQTPVGFLQRYLLADYPQWVEILVPAGSFPTAAG